LLARNDSAKVVIWGNEEYFVVIMNVFKRISVFTLRTSTVQFALLFANLCSFSLNFYREIYKWKTKFAFSISVNQLMWEREVSDEVNILKLVVLLKIISILKF
jgi:hypothetical protein